jgi:CRP-like cAMP-binding protein
MRKPAMSGALPPVNTLLARLPADDYRRIVSELEIVPLHHHMVVARSNMPARTLLFPRGGVCSITRTTADGGVAGVATVGREGFIGFGVVFGGAEAAGTAVVEVGDADAHVMDLRVFEREMHTSDAFRAVIHRYMHAFVDNLMQSVACNALHSVERRCARVLLEIADRVGSHDLPLTQEFLANTLGVRRPTVTLIVSGLQRTGLIDYRQRRIVIADEAGLRAATCECYGTMRRRLDGLHR